MQKYKQGRVQGIKSAHQRLVGRKKGCIKGKEGQEAPGWRQGVYEDDRKEWLQKKVVYIEENPAPVMGNGPRHQPLSCNLLMCVRVFTEKVMALWVACPAVMVAQPPLCLSLLAIKSSPPGDVVTRGGGSPCVVPSLHMLFQMCLHFPAHSAAGFPCAKP